MSRCLKHYVALRPRGRIQLSAVGIIYMAGLFQVVGGIVMFRLILPAYAWPWLCAAFLSITVLSCSGCFYGGYSGYRHAGYVGYQGYPVYQQRPIQVFGGYYQRGPNVRLAENRGRQSIHAIREPQHGHQMQNHGGHGARGPQQRGH